MSEFTGDTAPQIDDKEPQSLRKINKILNDGGGGGGGGGGDVNIEEIGGTAVATGTGVDGAGVQRVTLATNIALPAGNNKIGVVAIDQTASGVSNVVSIIPGVGGVVGGAGTTSAGTQRVVLATDGPLPAGENHIGQIGGTTILDVATPTLSVAGAYATGDYIGQSTTPEAFLNAVRVSAGTGIIKSLTIADKTATAAVALELWIFNATFTAPTDNAAWTLSSSDRLKCIGVIPIVTTKWYAGTAGKVYCDYDLGLPIKCAARDLYFALVARGTTPTWTAADLQMTLGILQD